MTKIALTFAAVLVATGSAFAASDSYQPVNTNRGTASATANANVDTMSTGSIGKVFTAPVDHGSANAPSDPSQRFWGR